MKIVIIATEKLKEDLLTPELEQQVSVTFTDRLFYMEGAGCYIDLLFDGSQKRIDELVKLGNSVILVNDVCHLAEKLPHNFIRINGWPGFLKRVIIEASLGNDTNRLVAEKVFSYFGKSVEWLPDTPGFIAPRVISMIINEAYFALEENVSTKSEIDTAMKTGTNYPYGPFEWAEKIGIKNIYTLLQKLSVMHNRFHPSTLLKNDALR